jgi:hypothetical protein
MAWHFFEHTSLIVAMLLRLLLGGFVIGVHGVLLVVHGGVAMRCSEMTE